MALSRMPSQRWLKAWIYYLFVIVTGTKSARPRFDTSTDMGMVLVPADAEIDSVIFRLRATDQDADFPLVFDITATVTPIVRIENLPCTLYNKVCQANVILTRRLTAGRLHDFAVRVRDSKGDSNSMQATISVTNATTPRDLIFPHIPALIMVPEDTKPGKELDYILVKSNPWSGKPVYIELWQPKELFTIHQRQTPTHTRGMITLIGELDFETQSMYTLTMYATDPYTDPKKDTRNIAGLQLVVIVKDVQDVPPIFTSAPPLTKLNNTIQTGDVILRVHAEDGDKGVPREVTYGLVSEGNPFTPFFNISESTGEIILARPLEQLTQITHIGAPVVLSVVAEEIRRSTDEPPAQATVVEVGLLLGEPGNSPPSFENDNYVAWMDENTELGSSVIFNEPYISKVHDEDIGKAGVFALKLENNNGTFEIGPTVAERTANFILTVRDNTLIDYEAYKSLQFKIIAQEVGPATNLSALVPVTIFLRDINDNVPQFDEKSYEVTLSENITAGTRVIQVHATDKDTGLFGRIQYTKMTGPGNEAFAIDPYTGIITIAMGAPILDREITSQLQLSVEARDENGQGLNGIVPLIVNLLDVNDNAPIFEKNTYEFTLNDDLTNFTMPAIIRALDSDSEPPNNQVRYELVHGNYDNKFVLDNTTGELFIREQITKIQNIRHNTYQRLATKFKKTFGQIQEGTTEKTFSTTKSIIPSVISNNYTVNDTNITEKLHGTEFFRRKREDKNILFTLTARAYDLGVPHLSGTTQVNILRSPATAARIVMFVVPGEHPDPIKTAQTLATITGGQITVQEIRPYTRQENLPNNPQNNLPNPETGKRSIVVARVDPFGPGASFVDIDKIRAALAANGVGVINDDMKNDGTIPGTEARNNGGTINTNNTVTTVHSEEVTVYRAENKLLTWLLIILGLLMLAAIIALIICCICPTCPFYMAPRKRRVHSSETLVAHSDGRIRRHIHHKYPMMMDATWSRKKQAWSADPTRNWQFNRRNVKNYGIASLPGDVTRIEIDREGEIPLETHSLHLRDAPLPMFVTEPIRPHRDNDRLYVEDMEASRIHGYSMTNIDQVRQEKFNNADKREINRNIRDQHYYREGNAEVMRLVTRGIGETTATMHHAEHQRHRNQPEIIIDQASVHRVDGKDILLRRFIEDQKLRIDTHDYHDSMQELERQSMESHQHQKNLAMQQQLQQQQHQQQQEILLIPENLEHRHIEELGPDVQRLIIEHGTYEKPIRSELKDTSQDLSARTLLIHGPMMKMNDKSPIDDEKQLNNGSNIQHYSIHDLELARQNALLTRLLLERDRGVGGGGIVGGGSGIVLDTGSYLETQSLPGQVAAGTQTNQTMATQTEMHQQPVQQQSRSRSDNDESEEEAKMRRRLKSKKRYDSEPKRIRTLWMKLPIGEDERQYEKRSNSLRKKMKDMKDGRMVSAIENEVLKEISDSLDETGDTPPTVRQGFADSLNSRYESTREQDLPQRDESSSVEMVQSDYIKTHKSRERSREGTRNINEPSFRILEREMSSLSRKLSKLVGKKRQESVEKSENARKLLKIDSKEENKIRHVDNEKRSSKIDIVKAKRSKSNQKLIGQSSSSKEQSKNEISDSVSSDKIPKPKMNYRQKLSISTGSSELEDMMEKPKTKISISKVIQGEKLKTKLLKNIKINRGQFKRQMAVDSKDGKKTSDTRVPDTGKRKEIITAPIQTLTKTEKKLIISNNDSDHMEKNQIQLYELTENEKTVQETDSGKNSDQSPAKIDDISLNQSGSSDYATKTSELIVGTSLELGEEKLSSKIESPPIEEIINITTDKNSSMESTTFDRPSESSPEKVDVKIIPAIETIMETIDHMEQDTGKIIPVSCDLVDSAEILSAIGMEENVEQPVTKTIESMKEVELISKPGVILEKILDGEKHIEKLAENVMKIIPAPKTVAKENEIEENNVELRAEESSESLINNVKDIAIEETDRKLVDLQIISPKHEVKIVDEVNNIELSADEFTKSIINDSNDMAERKLEGKFVDGQMISPEDEMKIQKLISIDGDLILHESAAEKKNETLESTDSKGSKTMEKIEEDPTKKYSEETPKSSPVILPKTILKITAPTISSDSGDFSIVPSSYPVGTSEDEAQIEKFEAETESKTPKLIQEVVVDINSSNQEEIRNAEEEIDDIKADEHLTEIDIDIMKPLDAPEKLPSSSIENENLQLVLRELLITNQSDRRSSTPTRVVISRETSFLNSPRKQSVDETMKTSRPISPEVPPQQPGTIILKSEIPNIEVKSPNSRGDQNITIDNLKSPEALNREIGSKEPPVTDELIETTLDILEDDSDASSESSTQTAFVAQPYGTPRHRRLVRMEHMDNVSTDDELKLPKADEESETPVDKVIEKTQPEISEDKIISTNDQVNEIIGKSLDTVVSSPEIIDESKKIEDFPTELTMNNNSIEKKFETLSEKNEDIFEEESIDKTENIQPISESEAETIEESKSSEGFLPEVATKKVETKLSDGITDVEATRDERTEEATSNKVESIFKFDSEQLPANVDGTSIPDQSHEMKKSDGDIQQLLKSPIKNLNRLKKVTSIKSESNDESKSQKSELESSDIVKRRLSGSQGMSKGRSKNTGDRKIASKIEKSPPMIDKLSDQNLRSRNTLKRQSNIRDHPNERSRPRKKLEHNKYLPKEKVKDIKSGQEKKLLHRTLIKEGNIDDERKSVIHHSRSPEKKGNKKLKKITKIGGIKKSSSDSEAEKGNKKLNSILEKEAVEILPAHSDIDENFRQTMKTSVEEFVELSKPIEVDEKQEILLENISQLSDIDTVNKDISVIDDESENKNIPPKDSEEMLENIPTMSSEATTSGKTLEIDSQKYDGIQKISKYNKDDHVEAQSRYMAWYKHNRDEAERRKREKKLGDDEDEEPPKWLRKSTRQRWLKMSPEDRKDYGVHTPEITPRSIRRKIQPLINIESEQLKAIVRQGRKLRRANGNDYDPPVEIFAPEKPPPQLPPTSTTQTTTTTTKYHYLIQHSEYKYEKISPPFYLHPPVPHSSPQHSNMDKRQFPCTSDESKCPDGTVGDIDTEIVVSMPGTNRLRHQQLLEKKSVFDIAYNEAAPPHLRADSTTPPS